jgi:ABC-type multidrug transport system ATPase subunit
MIELQDLRIDIEEHTILDGASARLDSGEVVALIGENGAGKTTLLRALAGLIPLARGRVALDGEPRKTTSPEWMSDVSYVADKNDLFPELSAREHFEVLRRLWDVGKDETLKREDRLLSLLGIPDNEADTQAKYLSFGYQKRLAIALSLFTPRVLFLFDEPFNGLDINSMAIFEAIVAYLRAAGKIVLISTHNVAQIGKNADRTLLLSGGRLADAPGVPRTGSLFRAARTGDEFAARDEPTAAGLGEFLAESAAVARLEWLEPAK